MPPLYNCGRGRLFSRTCHQSADVGLGICQCFVQGLGAVDYGDDIGTKDKFKVPLAVGIGTEEENGPSDGVADVFFDEAQRETADCPQRAGSGSSPDA